MATSTPKITCAMCGGSGTAPLRPASAVTYAALTAQWQTNDEIRARLGVENVKATALSNRLASLVSAGIAERRVSPANFRMIEYRRTPNGKGTR